MDRDSNFELATRELLDAVPAHVALLDHDGRIICVNAAWERFASENGIRDVATVGVGTSYLQVCGPIPGASDGGGAAGDGIVSVLEGKSATFETEYPCHSPSEERWYHMTVKATGFGAIVAHANVTGRRQAERLLGHQNKVLGLLASNADLRATLSGICELVEATVPGARCSILLKSGDFLVHAAGPSLPSVYNETLGAVPIAPTAGSCGTAAFRMEPVIVEDIASSPLWKKFGALALAHGLRACWSFPIRGAEDALLGTFAIYRGEPGAPDSHLRDVVANATHLAGLSIEQDAARAALLASEERFRILVNGVSDAALFLVSSTGAIVTWNVGAEKLFGHSASTIVGAAFATLFPSDRRTSAADKLSIASAQGSYQGETQLARADSSQFRAQVSASLLRNGDGSERGFSVLVRDLSERELLEEQLRQAQKMEAVGLLAGGVAHDFNNILTVIGCCTEALAAELPAEAPLQDMVAEIGNAADRATSLTTQLLAFSRRQLVHPVVLDLNEVVEGAEGMLHRILGEDVLIQTVCSSTHPNVRADRSLVDQIVLNLCVNARDAMPGGGRLKIATSDVRIAGGPTEAGGLVPGDYVELSITDTGPGIPESIRARIFEPFFTTKGSKGTGLGLAVVYGAVKQCGASIDVDCPSDGGTRMRVLFPKCDDAKRTLEPSRRSKTSREGGRVLIVEDEPALRALMRRTLERHGFEVMDASGGEVALSICRRWQPQALVTDVVMPNMSGRILADKVRELYPDLPVLFVSGYVDDAMVRHGVKEDRDQVLSKPFSSAMLAKHVERAIGRRRDQGEGPSALVGSAFEPPVASVELDGE